MKDDDEVLNSAPADDAALDADVEATVGAALVGEHIAAADAEAGEAGVDGVGELYALIRVGTQAIMPNWAYTDDECMAAAVAIDPVARKYGAGVIPIEVTMVTTLALLIMPRLGTPMRAPADADE